MSTVSAVVQPEPVSAKEAPRLRLEFLDGLRGLAALYVVFHHVSLFSPSSPNPSALLHVFIKLYTHVFAFGHQAVVVFIVLSGYVLMLPVARTQDGHMPKGVWDYFKRRARRILPPYYAALILSFVLIAIVPWLQHPPFPSDWDTAFPLFSKMGILTHLLMLHNLTSHGYNIDPPMWSVALEWQIYFLFPFVFLPLWRRLGILAPMGLSIAFSYGLLQSRLPIYSWTAPWLVVCFVFGMSAALINFRQEPFYQNLCQRMPWYAFAAVCLLGALFVRLQARTHLFGSSYEPSDALHNTHNLLTGMAAASFITGMVRSLQQNRRNLFLRILDSRPLVGLGSFSYSLYLVHYPLVAALFFALSSHPGSRALGWLSLLIFGVPMIVGVAYLFHLVFERPFMPTHLRKGQAKSLEQSLTESRS